MSLRRTLRVGWAVLMTAVLLLGGCAAPAGEERGEDNPDAVASEGFPRTLTDASGVTLTIEQEPQRIVSIAPSNTENAFALGLGEKVVGVSDWDNYPPEVEGIQKVGGLELNIETILSLEPDLVLAHLTANGSTYQALRDAGLKVLVLPDATDFESVYGMLRMLGEATGTEQRAEEVIRQMEEARAEVVSRVASLAEEEKRKVWIEIDPMLYTAGSGTFLHDIVTMAGGVNVAAGLQGWPQVTEEQVLSWNPDVILITYGDYVEGAVEVVQSRRAWAQVPAVSQGRIYEVDPDKVTRPGPRLAEGLAEVARALYPERFGQ